MRALALELLEAVRLSVLNLLIVDFLLLLPHVMLRGRIVYDVLLLAVQIRNV